MPFPKPSTEYACGRVFVLASMTWKYAAKRLSLVNVQKFSKVYSLVKEIEKITSVIK